MEMEVALELLPILAKRSLLHNIGLGVPQQSLTPRDSRSPNWSKRRLQPLRFGKRWGSEGAPKRSGMYAKRQDFVRCLLRLRSRGGCSGLQARASLKLPQSSRQQQFVRFG